MFNNTESNNSGILNNASNTYTSTNQPNTNTAKTTYIAQSGIYEFQDFTNANY